MAIPWSNETVPDNATPTLTDPEDPSSVAKVFEELTFGITGISSESRSGDANGPYIKVLAAGGPNTVVFPDPLQETQVGVTPLPILGTMPALDSSAKTPFRPDVDCETQEPPNLNSQEGPAPEQTSAAAAAQPNVTPELNSALADLEAPLDRAANLLDAQGKKAKQGKGLYEDTMSRLTDLLAQALGTETLGDATGVDAP